MTDSEITVGRNMDDKVSKNISTVWYYLNSQFFNQLKRKINKAIWKKIYIDYYILMLKFSISC